MSRVSVVYVIFHVDRDPCEYMYLMKLCVIGT